jgi:activator of 2-hydroxyglutaryl-CoA dehydratase
MSQWLVEMPFLVGEAGKRHWLRANDTFSNGSSSKGLTWYNIKVKDNSNTKRNSKAGRMKYKGKEYIEIPTAQELAQAAKQGLRAGIDVGSTTVKLAILDKSDKAVWSLYQRHHSDVRATVAEVLQAAADAGYGDTPMTIAITGSGGLLLAKWLNVEFVQEVIASKTAVETFIPQTDVAIELGGRTRRSSTSGSPSSSA